MLCNRRLDVGESRSKPVKQAGEEVKCAGGIELIRSNARDLRRWEGEVIYVPRCDGRIDETTVADENSTRADRQHSPTLAVKLLIQGCAFHIGSRPWGSDVPAAWIAWRLGKCAAWEPFSRLTDGRFSSAPVLSYLSAGCGIHTHPASTFKPDSRYGPACSRPLQWTCFSHRLELFQHIYCHVSATLSRVRCSSLKSAVSSPRRFCRITKSRRERSACV